MKIEVPLKVLNQKPRPKDGERQCGTCNLCCKVMGIKELEKPENQWCNHALKGGGCEIYGEHPRSCQIFRCAWLNGTLPDELHPRKIHAVLSTPDMEQDMLYVALDADWPNVDEEEPLRTVIEKAAQKLPVVIFKSDYHKIVGPLHLIKKMEQRFDLKNMDCNQLQK